MECSVCMGPAWAYCEDCECLLCARCIAVKHEHPSRHRHKIRPLVDQHTSVQQQEEDHFYEAIDLDTCTAQFQEQQQQDRDFTIPTDDNPAYGDVRTITQHAKQQISTDANPAYDVGGMIRTNPNPGATNTKNHQGKNLRRHSIGPCDVIHIAVILFLMLCCVIAIIIATLYIT